MFELIYYVFKLFNPVLKKWRLHISLARHFLTKCDIEISYETCFRIKKTNDKGQNGKSKHPYRQTRY